ncbi:electron transfer flavoprotein beta subunit/FixA family protein [Brevibacillus fluminis]|uniref:Electron transfer flavoprotein subunit beta n=1 Tax=Brevibacillus fluminis TaxID=511487 RepID=A0A3M8D199_9BACL|nr:electron transfer flavoprotein subunit beta/FixA family protein [Brevibacillus fluminis]RNB81197.1 electron transfer flavoprotein beta subunit/FixA family protein [Brevibacillus fluminis]
MDIVVLVKQTFDTEEKIVIQNDSVSENGVQFIMNPYDEYAVEEAIKLKEEHGGSVTVLSIGPKRFESSLRTALAMGADHAVLIETRDIALDEYSTGMIIATALKKRSFDMVLGGHLSIDNGSGQVCARLAELLQIPLATSITKLEIQNGAAVVQRDIEGDCEVLEVKLPAIFTAQQGLNEPRYPSLPNIMKAKNKPLERLAIEDLTVEEEQLKAKTMVIETLLPKKKTAGRILVGTLSDQARELGSIIGKTADLH